MGNFFKRAVSFILGMIFTLVIVAGAVIGGGYWAFKNLTLDQVMQENTLGEMGAWTVEDWYATITNASTNPEGFTLKTLEENGLDLDGMLTSMGVDVENANESDINALKSISVSTLMGGDFTNVSLGALLPFIPNNPETGKPVVFSEGARNLLRSYSIGDFFATDPLTQGPKALTILRQLSLGGVLAESYVETIEGSKYVYTAEHRGLNLLGNLSFALVTDVIEGAEIDVVSMLFDGDLKHIGSMEIRELIASFTATDDESYETALSGLGALADILVIDLFKYNSETSEYEFNVEGLLETFKLGSLLGYELCTCNANCGVHTEISECDGNLYDLEGNLVEMPGIEGDLIKNIAGLTINDFMSGGFDLNLLVKDVYLGKAFGYKIASNPEYCQKECQEEHSHNYYWVDSEDNYVGGILNQISNVNLQDVMTGNLKFDNLISNLKIGEIFGYVYDEVDARWETSEGVAVPNEVMGDKILYGLYSKTLTELMSGGLDLNELLGGIYLGEAFGYDKCAQNGYCDINCAITAEGHKHEYYWLDGEGNYVGELFNQLANVTLSDVLNGNLNVEGVIGDLKIGEFFGYVYDDVDARWETSDGVAVPNDTISDKILYGLYSKTLTELTSGGLDLSALLGDIYLGEAFGYAKSVKDGYCAPSCAITAEGHKHEYYWIDGENNYVGELFNQLANVTLSDVLEGNVDINGVINDTTIGEMFGYVYDDVDARWETSEGVAVPNDTISDKILYGLYSKSITDLSSGIDIGELLNGVYLGEAFGYDKINKTGYCDANCAITAEGHKHSYYWLNGEGEFVGELYNQLSNVPLTDVLAGKFDVESIINGIQIGEILGYVYDDVDERWETIEGVAVPNETVSEKLMYGLYSKTITSLSSGLDLGDVLEGVYLGETFGYKKANESGYCDINCNISTAGHTHKYYWVDASNKFVGELYNQLSNCTLTSVINGTFNVNGIINSVKIGEILGYVYDDVDARWETSEGVAVSKATVSEKVMYGMYSKTVNSLATGLDVGELLSGIYFGELLGFTRVGDDWEDENGKVDALYTVLSNIEVSKLMNGEIEIESAIGVLYVGELMGYVKDGSGWKDGTTPLSDVQVLLADIKLSEIFEGLDLTSKINALPLSSVIDVSGNKILGFLGSTQIGQLGSKLEGLRIRDVVDIPQTNKVLSAIKDTPINGLATAINDLEIGKMMGYVYSEDNARWETEFGEPVKGIEAKLAGLKVSDLSNGGIAGLNFVLSDVIDEANLSSGVFSLLGPDAGNIEVKNLAGALKTSMANASYQDLVNAQIISAVNNEDTLDTLFMTKRNGMVPVFTSKVEAHTYWTGLTITALMNEVIDLIGGVSSN